jgi:transposase-like protein
MARKTNLTLLLSPEERQTLESWQRSTTIRAGLAKRGRIILLLSEGVPISEVSRRGGIRRRFIHKWAKRFQEKGSVGSPISQVGEGGLFSPPEVALHLVKMACERPELAGRSLSQWDCSELARKLIEEA